MSNSSPVAAFPLDGVCTPCMQKYIGRSDQVKSKCSCRTMMKKFSYECEVLPHYLLQDFVGASEWVIDNSSGEFCFGHGHGEYYVHFSNPRDRVLYKMFWNKGS